MDLGLKGKAALVGGSSKGIGRAVAIGLAREGCNVCVCARDNAALAETARVIRSETDAQVFSLVCDMARSEDIKRGGPETAIDRLLLSTTARLGLIGMAKTLSRELAPEGITVNNVCPGNIATERLITLIEERARAGGIKVG